ncbi:hypothetical protein AN958_04749, partial [Leucoagaricus sp. SymC.cos]
ISHTSLEYQLIQAQTARIDLETKHREKELAAKRLERDRRHFADREREKREAREQLEAGHNAYTKQVEAECKSLRTQVSDFQETNTDLQNAHSQLSLSTATLSPLEHPSLNQRGKDEWMRGVNDQQDLSVVREELKWQTEYLRQLEGTNSRLNAELVTLCERHANIEVLREQNRSLGSKPAYTESLGINRHSNPVFSTIHPSKVPTISETYFLASLRLSHATLLEQHGSTLATLRTLESTNTDLSSLADSTSLCSSLKEKLKAEKEGRRKDDVCAPLAEREAGFLKALVASYQAEESAMDELKVDKLKVQRINDLETLLSDHNSTLTSLPSPSTTPPSSPSKPTQPSPPLLAELEFLKSKL